MTDKRLSLLVPIDFNEQSLIALEQSYNLAKLLRYNIILLYVLEERDFISSFFSAEDKEKALQSINQQLEEKAEEVSRKSGCRVEALVQKGKVHQVILKTAEQYHARFILMGTSDQGEHAEQAEQAKHLIGSNTLKVIRQAKIPVITFNGKSHFNGCRSILLPLDLTKETRQKVTYAIEIARLFNAKIKVMSALWDKNSPEIRQQLQLQMAQVEQFIKDVHIDVYTELIEVDGGQNALVPSILDFAHEEADVDLIMIMTQQENRLVEFFVGSAAQDIIRQSHVPVMSIIPKDLGFSYYQF